MRTDEEESPTAGVHARLQNFFDAFALALLDRKLELEGYSIVFYYDADVVLEIIMGFESELGRGGPRSSDRERLVRALLSCNFLGKIHMLRPHLYELERILSSKKSYLPEIDPDLFSSKARHFLEKSDISKIMAELLSLVVPKDDDSRAQNEEEFLRILSQCSGQVFASIEMVHGTWPQRLRRLRDEEILSFESEHFGPQMTQLFANYYEPLATIGKVLRRQRPKLTLNDYTDAAALAILHSMISAAPQNEAQYLVRFYTGSKYLQDALSESAALRKLLSYDEMPLQSFGAPDAAKVVFRSTAYFLMRAWFSDLAPAGGDSTSGLEKLVGLAQEMVHLLELEGEQLTRAMETTQIEGKTLIELIEDFERLTVMETIWARWPSSLFESLEEWTQVFAFAQGVANDTVLSARIEDTLDELAKKVSKIRAWSEDVEMIIKAMDLQRKRISGWVEDPMRDLGLVRWGYDLSQDEKTEVAATVKALIQGDESEQEVVLQLAGKMALARNSTRHCMIACAILWALGRFEDIVSLISDCDETVDGRLPGSLIVIQAAAQLRSGVVTSSQHLQSLVNRVWKAKESLPPEESDGLLLGVAYVLYHAWKQANIGGRIRHRDLAASSDLANAWAKMSFVAGEEAAHRLPRSDLAWAFAVNHCAYVGLVTGVASEKVHGYFEELLGLQSFPMVWDGRFDDTIGHYYLVQLEREWKGTPVADRGDLDFKDRISQARHYFRKAKDRDFGDIDIEEHIARLDLLNESLAETLRLKEKKRGK